MTMRVQSWLCGLLTFSVLVLVLAQEPPPSRVRRRTGDQSAPGQCTTFKWGGTTGWHWYVCCNNCEDTDQSCDGITYQSASLFSYCDTCGTDKAAGNGQIHGAFGCGSCTKQNIIRDGCTANLLSIFHIPGFCWAFTKCFQFYCTATRKRSLDNYTIPIESFNLQCDDGEDVNINPTDCCGTVNPQCNFTNYLGTNDCAPACCGEPSCCLVTDGSQPLHGGQFPAQLVVLTAMSLFIVRVFVGHVFTGNL